MDPRPLLDRFEGIAKALPLLPMADLPTPVERLEFDGRALWIKRDDLSSRLYGGNKVRKLEFLLGAARRAGARTLLTMGGVGSNHLIATVLHGREQGFRTVGVVFDQPLDAHVLENQAADRGAGAELFPCGSKYNLPLGVARAWARTAFRERKRPFVIPGGGSSPLGALGFVNAGLELSAQVRAGILPEPQALAVAYGTGGTAAGLAIGLRLGGLCTRVIAVRVIDRLLANRPRLKLFAAAVQRLLARHAPELKEARDPLANLDIQEDYFGPGYGHPTEAAEATRQAFAAQGITLETTYTAKAAAFCLDRLRAGDGPLLFWNTFSSADISAFVQAGLGPNGGPHG